MAINGRALLITAGLTLFLLTRSKKSSGSSGTIAAGMMGEHFSFDEFVRSHTCEDAGINNDPSPDQINAGKLLTLYILDPIRNWIDDEIIVNSWLRTDDCNDEVGGVPGSSHTTGGTADIKYVDQGVKKNWLIVRAALHLDLPFDRMLLEHGDDDNPQWIHIEFDPDKSPQDQRGQIWRIDNGTHGYQMTREAAENIFL